MDMIKKILKDVKKGENLDVYINILVASVLTLLNLIGIGQSYSMSIALSVLALLSISNLANRSKLDDILEKTIKTQDLLLEEYPLTLKDDVQKSQELLLIGINLGRTIPTYYPMLENKLQAKDFKLKILVLDPEGSTSEIAVKRANRPVKPENHKFLIHSTLADVIGLKQKFSSQVEVRVIDYMLPFGAFVINLKQSNAVIYLEHYMYKVGNDMPKMMLYPKDEQWFRFYQQQVESLWNDAVEWK